MERLATWLVTGPLGHFVAGALDWAELVGGYWLARIPWREPRSRGARLHARRASR